MPEAPPRPYFVRLEPGEDRDWRARQIHWATWSTHFVRGARGKVLHRPRQAGLRVDRSTQRSALWWAKAWCNMTLGCDRSPLVFVRAAEEGDKICPQCEGLARAAGQILHDIPRTYDLHEPKRRKPNKTRKTRA